MEFSQKLRLGEIKQWSSQHLYRISRRTKSSSAEVFSSGGMFTLARPPKKVDDEDERPRGGNGSPHPATPWLINGVVAEDSGPRASLALRKKYCLLGRPSFFALFQKYDCREIKQTGLATRLRPSSDTYAFFIDVEKIIFSRYQIRIWWEFIYFYYVFENYLSRLFFSQIGKYNMWTYKRIFTYFNLFRVVMLNIEATKAKENLFLMILDII